MSFGDIFIFIYIYIFIMYVILFSIFGVISSIKFIMLKINE
jgi:hypothetical protein